MEKKEYINGEDLIRKKILEEEQSFEPEAWTKMEALLERDPPAPVPGGSFTRPVFRWLALIVLCIAGWWLFREIQSGSPATESGRTMVSVEQGNKAAPAGAIKQAGKLPADKAPVSTPPNGALKAGELVTETESSLAGVTQQVQGNRASDKPADNAQQGVRGDKSIPETNQIPIAAPVAPFVASGDLSALAATATDDTRDQTFANPETKKTETETPHPVPTNPTNAWANNLNDLPAQLVLLESIIRPVHLPQHDVAPSARRVLAIGYGLGFNAALPQYGISQFKYSPHISLAVRYNVNNRLALRSELSLRKVDGYALSARFADSTFRPTGELLVYDYQVGSPGFVYVDMPVLLTYRLGHSRSAMMLGLRPGLVFPSDSWSSITGNWTPPNGYNNVSQGIRRFDCAVTLGWEFNIAPRFYLDLRYSQGWNDLTHDNFFQNNQTHLSSDIQLSFRHFFTQKP